MSPCHHGLKVSSIVAPSRQNRETEVKAQCAVAARNNAAFLEKMRQQLRGAGSGLSPAHSDSGGHTPFLGVLSSDSTAPPDLELDSSGGGSRSSGGSSPRKASEAASGSALLLVEVPEDAQTLAGVV
jgi:hypothetical protein